MNKLAKKEYWDSIYKDNFDKKGKNFFSIKNWVKTQTRDYSNFLIWESILVDILPFDKNLKIIEIGCAPGKYLINFNKIFGYEPFGVEYSENGAEITRKNFSNNNIKESNIILADFFDNEFQKNNYGKYDLVFSRGFIEHFDNVEKVINLHKNMVKNDGYIIVMIPNLKGLNGFLARFLNKKSYDLHNIEIMDKNIFSKLFSNNGLEEIYCDYVGLFSFGLFNTDKTWKYYLYRLFLLIQRPFDLLFRIFRLEFVKSKYSSPYLVFIGRKID